MKRKAVIDGKVFYFETNLNVWIDEKAKIVGKYFPEVWK